MGTEKLLAPIMETVVGPLWNGVKVRRTVNIMFNVLKDQPWLTGMSIRSQVEKSL